MPCQYRALPGQQLKVSRYVLGKKRRLISAAIHPRARTYYEVLQRSYRDAVAARNVDGDLALA